MVVTFIYEKSKNNRSIYLNIVEEQIELLHSSKCLFCFSFGPLPTETAPKFIG